MMASDPEPQPPTAPLNPPLDALSLPPAVAGSSSAPAGTPQSGTPETPKLAPQTLTRGARMRDVFCASAVVVFAFLLASFPARDSEVWFHLATGRAIAHGTAPLGAQPFLHTSDDHFWVNCSWLFDVLCYGIYHTLGPAALVIAKALLIALLAAVLLRRCPTGSGWITPLILALGLLALSSRLELQPICVSYLLLALTLVGLEGFHPRDREQSTSERRRRLIGVVALIVLWVNVDEWFLLGPLLVGLACIGTLLEHRSAPPASRSGDAGRAAWGLLFAGALLACLLNPYHVYALSLPESLTRSGDASVPNQAWHAPAALAYYLLVVLGLISFVANRSARRWSRALIWLALLALSVYHRPAAPFFAVGGAAIAAWNLRDFAARRASAFESDERRRWWRGVLTWSPALLLAGAVLAAWPGWLQGSFEPPQWTIESDASLEQAARQLGQWRADGSISAHARGFNLSPALAHYCAWFAPQERTFFSGRPRHAPAEVGADFLLVRQALSQDPSAAEIGEWRDVLRRRKITHLLVHDVSDRRLTTALRRLFEAPQEWRLVHLQGRVTVFVWSEGAARADVAMRLPTVDLKRRAFQPSPRDQAPPTGPDRDPEPRSWWHAVYLPRPAVDPNRHEALVYLAHFEAQEAAYLRSAQVVWENTLAGSIVALAAPPNTWGAVVGQSPRLLLLRASRGPIPHAAKGPLSLIDVLAAQSMSHHWFQSDMGPPESLFLAARAARRAIHANPDDPMSHLFLGQAYAYLARRTRERATRADLNSLHQVRKVQAITAFKTALALKPDLLQAHEQLAGLYLELKSFDLALEHLQEQVRLSRSAGPRPGESPDRFRERLQSLDDRVQRLGKQVRDAQNLLELQSSNLDVYGRARVAEKLGLPGKALEILLRSTYLAFGREGAIQELDLLLYTGRVNEVREWLEPQHEQILERLPYRRLQSYWAAATGHYAQADRDLADITVAVVDIPELKLKQASLRDLVAVQFALWLLEETAQQQSKLPALPRRVGSALLLRDDQAALLERMRRVTAELREQAERWTLRGMLALEAGAVDQAHACFRNSLSLWNSGPGANLLARRYLQATEKAAPP